MDVPACYFPHYYHKIRCEITLNNVENITTNELISKIENTLLEEKGGLIMTLAEQLRNEGREQRY